MIYSYGCRVDNDSNAITVIDEENETAVTTGYVNGEYVEFSGGGSSDFSTAQVTISNTTSNPVSVFLAQIEEDKLYPKSDVFPGTTTTVEAVLYKGSVGVTFVGYTATGSGSVEIVDSGAIITGDCTLTII